MTKMPCSYARIATEAQEQTALFEWAERMSGKYPVLRKMFASANGGSRKGGAREGARLKAQGVKAGVADIFLPCARGGYHGLFIELKRVRNWRTKENQIQFGDDVTEEGYRYCLCLGWEQAADRILQYLSMEVVP